MNDTAGESRLWAKNARWLHTRARRRQQTPSLRWQYPNTILSVSLLSALDQLWAWIILPTFSVFVRRYPQRLTLYRSRPSVCPSRSHSDMHHNIISVTHCTHLLTVSIQSFSCQFWAAIFHSSLLSCVSARNANKQSFKCYLSRPMKWRFPINAYVEDVTNLSSPYLSIRSGYSCSLQ